MRWFLIGLFGMGMLAQFASLCESDETKLKKWHARTQRHCTSDRRTTVIALLLHAAILMWLVSLG